MQQEKKKIKHSNSWVHQSNQQGNISQKALELHSEDLLWDCSKNNYASFLKATTASSGAYENLKVKYLNN